MFLPRSLFKKVRRLEKSTPPPVVAVVTNMRCAKRHSGAGFFCPKEGERVALGHFHERVGESPRSDENFGTSGCKIRCFVFEIWPFDFTM